MKLFHAFFILIFLSAGAGSLLAHGPGHFHGSREAESAVNAALDLEPDGQPPRLSPQPRSAPTPEGKSLQSPVPVAPAERIWGASLATGWESRHVHYGVDETGPGGAYTTELSLQVGDLLLGVWNGFGTGNRFEEWDFTAAYNLALGPVFLIPGYNFRYTPGIVEQGHSASHEEHHDHDHEAEQESAHSEGHLHRTYGNELFLVLGTTAWRYVTPSAVFIWDLNNTPGAFMELRLDGEIPLFNNRFTLEPYTLLGLNFGYNTRSYYGWNNWQFGLQGTWQINEVLSIFAGVNYSVAMTALREIQQPNVVWANVGLRFAY